MKRVAMMKEATFIKALISSLGKVYPLLREFCLLDGPVRRSST